MSISGFEIPSKIRGIQPRYENFEISEIRAKYEIFENLRH